MVAISCADFSSEGGGMLIGYYIKKHKRGIYVHSSSCRRPLSRDSMPLGSRCGSPKKVGRGAGYVVVISFSFSPRRTSEPGGSRISSSSFEISVVVVVSSCCSWWCSCDWSCCNCCSCRCCCCCRRSSSCCCCCRCRCSDPCCCCCSWSGEGCG